MPITVLDAVVLIVVLISATLAMVRGFVREILSVGSWVAAAAAAYFFYKPVVPFVSPYVESAIASTIIAVAVIFFIALIIASYITMRIADFVIDSRVGAVDRILGFVFGAVRGVLILVVAVFFFNFLVPNPPAWFSQASTKPFLTNVGDRVIAALPEDFEASMLRFLRGNSDPASTPEPPTGVEEGRAPDDPAYNTGARHGLDQLIETANPG